MYLHRNDGYICIGPSRIIIHAGKASPSGRYRNSYFLDAFGDPSLRTRRLY